MSDIERVARAMFACDHDEPWEQGEDLTRDIYLNNAAAAIAAHKAALAEAGLVIVPREPTQAMASAAKEHCEAWRSRPDVEWAGKIMGAMIAAHTGEPPND